MFLVEGSEYFRTMFKTEMRERGQQEIAIKKVDGDILRQLIEYCYSGQISISSTNVMEMTKAADMFQFDEVKENCTEFYSTMLHPSNCLGIQEFADLHNMAKFKEAAHKFILRHFEEVSKCNEFLFLDVDNLSGLLAEDDLNVLDEEGVFDTLIGWVKHDLDGRKPLLKDLLKCVRFTHIKDSVSDVRTLEYVLQNY